VPDIAANIEALRASIANACGQTQRSTKDVKLVAVSKTVDLPQIAEAIAAGVQDFGENRTALLKDRQEEFAQVNWHFIGTIQTNKLKDVVGRADLIHSVASQHALEKISNLAFAHGIVQDILIEVNVSGEKSKTGLPASELDSLLEQAAKLANLRVCGLMTMAPRGCAQLARQTFADLRETATLMGTHYNDASNVSLTELSMGMSEDYIEAIQEGATIVRIGRSVWNSRID
jgi:pyridoxal phosphate enzyme (YggS family)